MIRTMRQWMLAAILVIICGAMTVQAQVMKAADLEKYAKEKYGDKWLDAAKNLAEGLTLDKNESLTYQQVIQAEGKSKQQLYVALNYWATATFKDHNAITLNDKEAGCIIVDHPRHRGAHGYHQQVHRQHHPRHPPRHQGGPRPRDLYRIELRHPE